MSSICRLNADHFFFFSLSTVYDNEEKEIRKKERQADLPVLFFFPFLFFCCLHTRVVDGLPGHNKLLLQYLICILHHILQSADVNKMDAHNLAVCIGPTLLQLDDTPLDGQREKMQKVENLDMSVRSHFWCFEALWFTVQKNLRFHK